jgi:hypothetical protein
MSDALNLRCFEAPHWYEIARGSQLDLEHDDDYNGGLLMPRSVDLPTGQTYFRFADSKRLPVQRVTSPWWIEYETLLQIRNYSQQFARPREAVRYMLAVPWDWNRVDTLLSAILYRPLKAYRGKGKPVRLKTPASAGKRKKDEVQTHYPPHHLEIWQLCIPGLGMRSGSRGASDPVYRLAFPEIKEEDIWASKHFR